MKITQCHKMSKGRECCFLFGKDTWKCHLFLLIGSCGFVLLLGILAS